MSEIFVQLILIHFHQGSSQAGTATTTATTTTTTTTTSATDDGCTPLNECESLNWFHQSGTESQNLTHDDVQRLLQTAAAGCHRPGWYRCPAEKKYTGLFILSQN